VLYWYQSPNRVVASEYKAKFWTVADAIRYNRTDTSLVRVVVPVPGTDEAAAEHVASRIRAVIFQHNCANICPPSVPMYRRQSWRRACFSSFLRRHKAR